MTNRSLTAVALMSLSVLGSSSPAQATRTHPISVMGDAIARGQGWRKTLRFIHGPHHASKALIPEPQKKAQVADVFRRAGAQQQVAGFNFDWDDNVVVMPTKLWLRNTKGGRQKAVTSAEFAVISSSLGKPGPYADYDVDPDPRTGTMREMRDQTRDPNLFLRQFKQALRSKAGRGPSWEALVAALNDPETARFVTVISARGHAPRTVLRAFKYLKHRGIISYLPLERHIYQVNDKRFELDDHTPPDTMSTPERKAHVMINLLDRLNAIGLGATARSVISPDGVGQKTMQLWGFSDDDFGNFQKAVTVLGKEVAAGRWPNVKVSLLFTGKNHPTEKPRAVVLRADGTTRPMLAEESEEVARVVADGAPPVRSTPTP